MPLRSKRTKVCSTILLLVAAGLWLWLSATRAADDALTTAANKKEIKVSVSLVTKRQAPQVVTVYGSTISPDSVHIAALNAAIVKAILFTAGQQVRPGQVLFSLKLTDTSMQLTALKSAMQQTGDSYRRMQRYNQLSPGSVAKDDVETSYNKYMQAKQAYLAAQAASRIKAPAAGTISTAQVAIGERVAAGQTLATLISADDLQVQYTLPSQYVGLATIGQTMTFTASGQNTAIGGHVIYVAPQLNTNSELTIRARLDAATKLALGQFGQIKQIVNPHAQMLMVPQSLVQTDAGGFYVYGIELGKVTKHYFQPGTLTSQGWLEVKSGLTASTLIITKQSGTLDVGQKVQVIKSATKANPQLKPAVIKPATQSDHLAKPQQKTNK